MLSARSTRSCSGGWLDGHSRHLPRSGQLSVCPQALSFHDSPCSPHLKASAKTKVRKVRMRPPTVGCGELNMSMHGRTSSAELQAASMQRPGQNKGSSQLCSLRSLMAHSFSCRSGVVHKARALKETQQGLTAGLLACAAPSPRRSVLAPAPTWPCSPAWHTPGRARRTCSSAGRRSSAPSCTRQVRARLEDQAHAATHLSTGRLQPQECAAACTVCLPATRHVLVAQRPPPPTHPPPTTTTTPAPTHHTHMQ